MRMCSWVPFSLGLGGCSGDVSFAASFPRLLVGPDGCLSLCAFETTHTEFFIFGSLANGSCRRLIAGR